METNNGTPRPCTGKGIPFSRVRECIEDPPPDIDTRIQQYTDSHTTGEYWTNEEFDDFMKGVYLPLEIEERVPNHTPMQDSDRSNDPLPAAQHEVANARTSVRQAQQRRSKATIALRNKFITDLEEILAYRELLKEPSNAYDIEGMHVEFAREVKRADKKELEEMVINTSPYSIFGFQKSIDNGGRELSYMLSSIFTALSGGVSLFEISQYCISHELSRLWAIPALLISVAIPLFVHSKILGYKDDSRAVQDEVSLKEANRRRWVSYNIEVAKLEIGPRRDLDLETCVSINKMLTTCKTYFADCVKDKVALLQKSAEGYAENAKDYRKLAETDHSKDSA